MKPEEFKAKWNEFENNLNRINPANLQGLNLSQNSIEFLSISGLPDEASPYLTFKKDSNIVFQSVQKISNLFDFLDDSFDKYVIIGSCDDGDFIVINTEKNDRIERLNHENDFESEQFNSSINATAECLIIYRDFIQDLIKNKGEDAYFNSEFTDKEFENLKAQLTKADSHIMNGNSFWSKQLNLELELRDERMRDSNND